MAVVNHYSLAHLVIWLLMGRYTGIGWVPFLVCSLGWECLEWVLPFEFAVESIDNKLADIVVNILGFSWGRRTRRSPR